MPEIDQNTLDDLTATRLLLSEVYPTNVTLATCELAKCALKQIAADSVREYKDLTTETYKQIASEARAQGWDSQRETIQEWIKRKMEKLNRMKANEKRLVKWVQGRI